MPTDTQPSPAEQLADLLDGRIDVSEVTPEVAKLADLATAVRTHVTLVPPTDAFREALREQVVQAATAPASGLGSVPAPGASTVVSTGTSAVSSLVAGVAAAAVLVTSTVAAADRAGPGDLLAGLDRALEQGQLALADDATDVDLLVQFAAERVLEALDVVDIAVVNDLLGDAEALVDDALVLALAQGRAVEDVVQPYVGALLTLASRTDDPAVRAEVEQRLVDLGVGTGVLDDLVGEGTTEAGQPGGADGDVAPVDPGDEQATDGDDVDADAGDPVDDVVDDVDDLVDDATDDVDDLVDDLTDPLDDVTDPVEDLTDDATDAVDDATGGLGG